MGGTKIIVVQMKELIKTAIFAVIGLILIIMLIFFFVPKEKKEEEVSMLYIPGSYVTQILLQDTPVDVVVTVTENEIVSIDLANLDEAHAVFYPLIKPTMDQLSSAILESQSLDIQTSENNTYTTKVLLDAVSASLEQAKPTTK